MELCSIIDKTIQVRLNDLEERKESKLEKHLSLRIEWKPPMTKELKAQEEFEEYLLKGCEENNLRWNVCKLLKLKKDIC